MEMKRGIRLVVALGVMAVSATAVHATTVYDNIASPLPGNVPSLGYEATATKEFGDQVNLAGTDRLLNTVTVAFSDWAVASDYPTYQNNATIGGVAGFMQSVTVNVYLDAATARAGDTMASTTASVFIPYRPAIFGFNGILSTATFDFIGQHVTLPNTVIVGIAYNTADYGNPPVGANGPYNSLNVGTNTAPTVGSLADSDVAFWNTSVAGFYTDGGASGVGVFRADTQWTGYTPSFSIDAVPLPASVWTGLTGLALVAGLSLVSKYRPRIQSARA